MSGTSTLAIDNQGAGSGGEIHFMAAGNNTVRIESTGNTVIVIEHNLDVIKTSDWIIDVGPEGGDNGGLIVAQGVPDKIIKTKNSYTGKFLKEVYK